ncbi:MAG: site-specific DNA-methyltransferase [Deferribacteraceae bacterium]|nr:site-specific DNA-methyltransferase [Deferribacteraceae bacterium]
MSLFEYTISEQYNADSDAVFLTGDVLKVSKHLPDNAFKLIISSPPYNIGKEYEKETALDDYLHWQEEVLKELYRCIHTNGSIVWQVGNYVDKGEIYPLDVFFYPIFKRLGLKLRNRIVWHFGHGLHASKRFSGRYEVLLWFTKGDEYTFNLDSVRVASKYPGKLSYKGKNIGKPSGNPLGKNPTDFWEIITDEWEEGIINIPNVKSNHPEKTEHPCSFPIELIERSVLALTDEADAILDPFGGVGSTLIAAIRRGRRGVIIDKEYRYIEIAKERVKKLENGLLKVRNIGTPIYTPTGREKISQAPLEWLNLEDK